MRDVRIIFLVLYTYVTIYKMADKCTNPSLLSTTHHLHTPNTTRQYDEESPPNRKPPLHVSLDRRPTRRRSQAEQRAQKHHKTHPFLIDILNILNPPPLTLPPHRARLELLPQLLRHAAKQHEAALGVVGVLNQMQHVLGVDGRAPLDGLVFVGVAVGERREVVEFLDLRELAREHLEADEAELSEGAPGEGVSEAAARGFVLVAEGDKEGVVGEDPVGGGLVDAAAVAFVGDAQEEIVGAAVGFAAGLGALHEGVAVFVAGEEGGAGRDCA